MKHPGVQFGPVPVKEQLIQCPACNRNVCNTIYGRRKHAEASPSCAKVMRQLSDL